MSQVKPGLIALLLLLLIAPVACAPPAETAPTTPTSAPTTTVPSEPTSAPTTPPGEPTALPEEDDDSLVSPFGVFSAYTLEYTVFQQRMGFDDEEYWDWVDGHFEALGAHWTRSNLQLIWDFVEPVIGQGYDWENQFATDRIVAHIAASPATVHWVGVFHEGGASDDPSKDALRNPADYPGEYARFVRDVVERYDGDGVDDLAPGVRVCYWQIGNEYPGWKRVGRTLDEYFDWARLTAAAIREADPTAKVVLTAETQGIAAPLWLQAAIEALAPEHVIDVVDLHHWGPAGDWQMPAVAEVRALLDDLGRSDAEIFSCEHGTWAGDPDTDPVQTEEEQARSLVKRYVYNLNNGLDKLFWNNLMEWEAFAGEAGSIFNSIGLVSDGRNSGDAPDRFNTPRIAYWSYRLLAQNLGNDIRLGERIDAGDDDVYLYRFPAAAGTGVRFVGWSESGAASITVREPGFTGEAVTLVPDRYGDTGAPVPLAADPAGDVVIELGIDPVLVTGYQ